MAGLEITFFTVLYLFFSTPLFFASTKKETRSTDLSETVFAQKDNPIKEQFQLKTEFS